MNYKITTKNEVRNDYRISADDVEEAIEIYREGVCLTLVHSETSNIQIVEVTVEKKEITNEI